MNDPVLIALIVALVAAAGSYLVAARQFSGRIETSDARDLWAESRAIRDWSTKRMEELNQLVSRLETRIVTLESENRDLNQHIAELEGGSNARP
jgi:uncharacterized protein HemX